MLNTTNKKLALGLLALTFIVGSSVVGYKTVNADTTTTTRPTFMSGFVKAIAQKFGLSESDVQAVVDSEAQKQRAEMEAKFQQDFATRLAQAVTDGKLTQAEADLIKAKQAEVKTQLDTLRADQSYTSREKMRTLMDSVRTWAETNNIPKEFVMFGFGPGGYRGGPGGMGHFGRGMMKNFAPTPTTQTTQ
jgi:hypothetical protein